MTLDELRRQIDALDAQIVGLLDRRVQAVLEAIGEKRQQGLPMHDPEREQRVLEHAEAVLANLPDAKFPRLGIRPVFREILSACLSVGGQLKVAYLGPPGTFTHEAAQSVFGLAAEYVPVATIPGVFDAVTRRSAGYGVIPIENSTEGSVSYTLDSLLETEVKIRRELVLEVTQCLLGAQEDLMRIERVYSHPQGLAQCRLWLAKHLPNAQLVASHSTSAAAREASLDGSAAAVASKLAAELNGLSVLREGIQDRRDNSTRFVLVAEEDAPPTGQDKTSLLFSTPHEQGALRAAIEIIHAAGLNMTRIESRPRPDARWEYVFFTDVEGHRHDPAVATAIQGLSERCAFVKVLGSYPRAQQGTESRPTAPNKEKP